MPPLEGNSGISLEKTCKNRPPLPKKTTTAEKKLDNKTSSPSLEPSFERSDSVKRGLFQRLGTSSSSKCAVDESPMKKEGFQRSLSWNRNSSKSLTKKPLPADNDLQLVEEDPVVALFEARNTQRVRFSLEGKQPTRDSIATVQPIKEKQDPTFNIKTFMSKALFKSGSSFTLRVEPLKAEMKKSSIRFHSSTVPHNRRKCCKRSQPYCSFRDVVFHWGRVGFVERSLVLSEQKVSLKYCTSQQAEVL